MGSMLSLMNPTTGIWDALSMPDFVVGVRDPEAEEGIWDRAFVGGSHNGKLYMVQFNNHLDFVGHPKTRHDIILAAEELIRNGWKPMTPDDIHKTAGIVVAEAAQGTANIVQNVGHNNV